MIRRADVHEADAVAHVLEEAFVGFQPMYTEASYAATVLKPDGVRARMRDGPLWVATLEDEVIGTCGAKLLDDELYLRGMAVSPTARGKGAGQRLLAVFEKFAIDAGTWRLTLSTAPFLASAIGLYQRCGFVQNGKHPWLGVTLVDMHKELR